VQSFTINIDGRALSHDLLPIGTSTSLSRCTVNQLTVIPGTGYGFVAGSGIVADLQYGVGQDGSVQLDPKFAAFASASGNTLTIRGYTINIDGRALSHDLRLTNLLNVQPVLSRTTVNQLTVIPSVTAGYGFQAGSILANFNYGIGRDGSIQLAPKYAG
jgi:hypothetical protein